jgi:four helix bundle protein
MKNFKTLDLAIEYHDAISKLNAVGHLRDQLHRSASSIALNLSEGNAKPSLNEKRRYYQIAYGSLKESETTLKLLKINDSNLIAHADHLGASIYKLMNSKFLEVMDARKN